MPQISRSLPKALLAIHELGGGYSSVDHGAYLLRHAVYQSDKNNGGSYSDQFANISEDAAGGKDGESKI